MSNAPSKPVSFSRPKVGYFSNRPRIVPENLLHTNYRGAHTKCVSVKIRASLTQLPFLRLVNYKLYGNYKIHIPDKTCIGSLSQNEMYKNIYNKT